MITAALVVEERRWRRPDSSVLNLMILLDERYNVDMSTVVLCLFKQQLRVILHDFRITVKTLL